MLHSPSDFQDAFGAALLDPERPVPPGVVGRDCIADTRRFAVYRNNIMVGLVDALRARFPVTQRLVGEEFFQAMARVYVAAHKPRTPLLMHYGDDFPDFIADFEPASSVAYLPDVARLERAWSQAYHAHDASPLSLDALRTYGPEQLKQSRLRLHPSLRLLRSLYPVATIWAAHQAAGEVVPPQVWEAQDILVLRPDAEVVVHRLPPGGYPFIAALAAGPSLEAAAVTARTQSADFDVGRHLVGLVSLGAVVALDVSSWEIPSQGVTA